MKRSVHGRGNGERTPRLGRVVVLATLLVLVLLATALVPPARAAEPAPPGPRDRCPVCGMFVAQHPTWVAVVVLDDGRREYFDGPKDMFRFLLEPTTYRPGSSRDSAVDVWVRDYYTTRPLDARTASFVVGTDVLGPMGHELVPVSSADVAGTLLKDHGGARILTFDQVTIDDLP